MFQRKSIVGGFLILFLAVIFLLSFQKNTSSVESIQENKSVEKTELKIGYITDLHCYSKLDSKTNKLELNKRCSEPIAKFTNQMNENYFPDVIVDGGDLVDGRDDRGNILYPVLFNMFDDMPIPHYHILGNHETNCFTKSLWREFTGCDNYYYKDVNDYRLIFLDGNNKIGDNGQDIDTSPDVRYYPGYLGQVQRTWLEKTLRDSVDKNILVFVHQPPLNKTIVKTADDLFIEGDKIRELFSEYGVRAVFSGHIEELCYIEENAVKYYVLKGVHKKNGSLLEKDSRKDQGIFYEISIKENQEIEVEMFFKENGSDEYDSMIVNNKTAFCNNKSVENFDTYNDLVEQELLIKEQAKVD